jgi:hypothetical protein
VEDVRVRLVRLVIERGPKNSPIWLKSDGEEI